MITVEMRKRGSIGLRMEDVRMWRYDCISPQLRLVRGSANHTVSPRYVQQTYPCGTVYLRQSRPLIKNTNAMTTPAPRTGFLSPPAELRAMVYNFIPDTRVHRHVQLHSKGYVSNTVIIVALIPASAVRLTCRLIAAETEASTMRPMCRSAAKRCLFKMIVGPEVVP
jgi:hypothetical protein